MQLFDIYAMYAIFNHLINVINPHETNAVCRPRHGITMQLIPRYLYDNCLRPSDFKYAYTDTIDIFTHHQSPPIRIGVAT